MTFDEKERERIAKKKITDERKKAEKKAAKTKKTIDLDNNAPKKRLAKARSSLFRCISY